MKRALLGYAVGLAAVASAGDAAGAQPVDVVIAPVERALERVSLGPQVGIGGVATLHGGGAQVTLGLAATVFDRFVRTDPACEAARAEERRRLGGDTLKPWGDVVGALQQPCRPIEEWWYPLHDAGLELGLGIGEAKGGHLRGFFAPLSWRRFTLALSASALLLPRDEAASAFGLRLGPEVAVHFRQTHGDWRPVLTGFLRLEPTVLGRSDFADQAVLGVRYLFDL